MFHIIWQLGDLPENRWAEDIPAPTAKKAVQALKDTLAGQYGTGIYDLIGIIEIQEES